MEFEPKSVAEQIECLARLTGASDAFAGQVRALFSKKGISLEADATPYISALEEAFRREAGIRCNAERARESITRLHSDFSKIGEAYVKQVEQLRKIQSGLRDQTRRSMKTGPGKGKNKDVRPVTIRGDHRTYITRPQTEELPMVPGPKEVQ